MIGLTREEMDPICQVLTQLEVPHSRQVVQQATLETKATYQIAAEGVGYIRDLQTFAKALLTIFNQNPRMFL